MGNTNGFRIENGKLISYSGDDLEIIIPDEVTEIGSSVFANSGVRKVVIGDSVKIIGEKAFKDCATLIDVSLPNGLEKIGASAFEDCVGLQKIHIGDSVEIIGEKAFAGCTGLRQIHGGSKIKRIGDAAFQKCPIAEFDFSSVTSIGAEAFSDCKLTEVTFGRGLASLGRRAFWGCDNLRSVIFDADSPLETIEDEAFRHCSVTDLQLPAHLKKIGDCAFHLSVNYDIQKEIVLPDSLKIIGKCAFDDSKFELIIIPYGVTHIGAKSFEKTRKIVLPEVFRAQISNFRAPVSDFVDALNVIYYQTEEQYEKLKEYGFLMDGGYLIKFVRKASTIEFPDFVTRICRDAFGWSGGFDWCGLSRITIPEHIVIEEGAFDCPTLKYVTVSKQYKKKRKLYFGDYKIKYTFI